MTRQSPDSDQTKDKKIKKVEKDKSTSVETQAIAWSPTDGWSGITDQDQEEWGEAYPACDVSRQLAAMGQWLKANPAKAKKKAWRRFVTNWLARTQERGGDMRGGNAPKATPPPPKSGEIKCAGRTGFVTDMSKVAPDPDFDEGEEIPF